MSPETIDSLLEFALALGIGLFVGLEREHHETASDYPESPGERGVGARSLAMGARTFALLSMLGWVIGFIGSTWTWLPPVGLLVVGGVVAAQYAIAREGVGLTTEVAAIVTFVLGMLVTVHRELAVAVALATALLLVSKPLVWSVISKLRQVEVTATVQLLILFAIVLPILPEQPVDPWQILPPRKIGLFVVLIAGIGFVGYVLSRMFGARRGAGLTGLVGGLTSSTAVTVAMSKAGRSANAMREPGKLAVFLANAVMFARVIVVTAVLSRDVALLLAIPMTAMGLIMLVGVLRSWRRLANQASVDPVPEAPAIANPFELLPALQWGAILCLVLVVAYFAQLWFGDSGLLAAAAASGLADVDAITIAVANQASNGTLAVETAALAVSIAVVSNTIVKGALSVVAGGRAFGLDIAITFSIAIAVGLAAAIVTNAM
ncbi:MAG: DUF4010 domain-containing protein [Proteobacteria bacterium]|nr:DUF4010 domain-containing protein [Pseudomonadota bacterium]